MLRAAGSLKAGEGLKVTRLLPLYKDQRLSLATS